MKREQNWTRYKSQNDDDGNNATVSNDSAEGGTNITTESR